MCTIIMWFAPILVDLKSCIDIEFCTQVAIEAIFSTPGGDDTEGGPFTRHADGKGFDLTVVPHPGDAEANVVWAEIGIRCAGCKRALPVRQA